jgi:glutamyl/glutaminyl-tRNA synthetase
LLFKILNFTLEIILGAPTCAVPSEQHPNRHPGGDIEAKDYRSMAMSTIWDVPRLYTLIGLRRRGVLPGVLLAFVNELGVTKAQTTIDVKRFEQVVRRYFENTLPRLMLVLDPISVVIVENLPEDFIEMVELPFSKDP